MPVTKTRAQVPCLTARATKCGWELTFEDACSRCLHGYLALQLLIFCAMVPVFWKAPTRWLEHCSVMLTILRVSWLPFTILISRIWPAKQWLLIFPPNFAFLSSFTQFLVPMPFKLFAVTHLLLIGQGLCSFWFACEIVTKDLIVRFLISAILIWMCNVWNEDTRRRRLRQHRIFRSEMIHLRDILHDLLPLDLDEPERFKKEREMHSGAGTLHRSSCQLRRAVVLQLDICGFTEFSQTIDAMELAKVMHYLFSAFDTCVQNLGLFKMDTIGDAYVVAGWLHSTSEADFALQQEQAQRLCQHVLRLAGAMLDTIESFCAKSAHNISARIGIGVGNVVVGALGSLQPRVHIRGDGMRVAEGLEQTGSPSMLHVDDTFLDTLQSRRSHLSPVTVVAKDVSVAGNAGSKYEFLDANRGSFITAGLRWRKRAAADQVCKMSKFKEAMPLFSSLNVYGGH